MSDLLTPAQAADMCGVTTKTLIKWDRAGKIKSIRTLGGHRRFRRSDIEAALFPTEDALASTQEDGSVGE